MSFKVPKTKIPFSTTQLMKIASFGAIFVIGNGILMRWLTHKKFKQSPYFIQAQETVLANRALVDVFGEPVDFGIADLDNNSRNFSTPTQAQFEIPVTGSKTKGMLYLSAVRNPEENSDNSNAIAGWKIKSLEVTVQDKPNQKLILVEKATL